MMSALAVAWLESEVTHKHCRTGDDGVTKKLPRVVGIPLLPYFHRIIRGRDFHFQMLVEEVKVAGEVRIDNQAGDDAQRKPDERTPFKSPFCPTDHCHPDENGQHQKRKHVVGKRKEKCQYQQRPILSCEQQMDSNYQIDD